MDEMNAAYFFRAGGLGMIHVCVFGVIVLAAAARFALHPDERKVPFLRAMTAATLLAIACAVVTDFATVLWNVPHRFAPERWAEVLMVGTFESLTPAVLGFALLSFAWLIKAVGMRRLMLRIP